MSSSLKKLKARMRTRGAAAVALTLAVAAAGAATVAVAQERFPGIGRTATPKEVAAWDIDVRPDFKGLPAGSGSVAKGQDIWEARCASCHGVFGESNSVFSPLVGGTTAEDVKTGRVAALKRTDFPGRTTMMKAATVSTLWDYIHRAMPWDKPKSLSADEVYAVTAFLLNLANVVPENFTLSDKNIADVQKRMPNRDGMTTAHALWPGKELGGQAKPDVLATACMSNCGPEPRIASRLPEHARNSHGNLREQNRTVGAQLGVDTTKAEGKLGESAGPVKVVAPAGGGGSPAAAAVALTQKYTCTACHNIEGKLVGPSFTDIAKRHAGKADLLAEKIKSGGVGAWGEIPMPPQELPAEDAKTIASWLAAGASKP